MAQTKTQTNPSVRVSKFGGTSMGDAHCMRRSAALTVRRGSHVVVVSATSGTTNDLIQLGRLAQEGDWTATERQLWKIHSRHRDLGAELRLNAGDGAELARLLDEMESLARGIHLLRDCSLKALDALMSFGERLSSLLFTEAVAQELAKTQAPRRARWFDVRDVLRTDDHFSKARPQTEILRALCEQHLPLNEGTIWITQGFIGKTEEGATTTLGRGGSDYSAALLAEALGASVLEIWTDVPGISSTDPRLCPDARPIPEISFKEASELATFGAKILHPATLLPAIRKNIPVFVGSSFDAGTGENGEENGTWVRRETGEAPLIRALALRKRQILVTLTTPEMLNTHGFLARIFKVFDDHEVSVDAVTTSEISVSLTLDEDAAGNRKLLGDLARFAEVQVEKGLTLVSLIGNSINHTPGLARRVFQAIEGINVRMICLGASKHNFCFLVNEDQAESALRALHGEFIPATGLPRPPRADLCKDAEPAPPPKS